MIDPIPDELLERVIALLNIKEVETLPDIKQAIFEAAKTYRCMQRLLPPLASAKHQKAKIEQMGLLAHKLLNVSKDIQWDYFNTLDYVVHIAEPPDVSFRPLTETQADLERIKKGCELFLKMFKPSKGSRTNALLQEVVRELIVHIRDTAGIEVTIARNKHGTGTPSFASAGSKAIAMLLRGIDPRLSETAIANMIDKVARGQLSADPLDDLIDLYSAPVPTFK